MPDARMFSRNCALLGLFTLALLAGCDKNTAPYSGREDPVSADMYPTRAVEGALQEALVFDDPRVTPSAGRRPLAVVQPLRNVEKYDINVQYRFEFFDAGMNPLPGATGWRFLNLPVRMQRFVEANAFDTRAVHWRLEVRSAR